MVLLSTKCDLVDGAKSFGEILDGEAAGLSEFPYGGKVQNGQPFNGLPFFFSVRLLYARSSATS